MTQEHIGFAGLGLMGHGMAKNIVTKGYPLTVTAHRNRSAVDDLTGRGAVEASLADLAASVSQQNVDIMAWMRQIEQEIATGNPTPPNPNPE